MALENSNGKPLQNTIKFSINNNDNISENEDKKLSKN